MDTKTIYTSLCREFSETYQLKKGGTELDYLSGEQVVTRLNDVLGMDGWDFRALGNGRDDETIWVHGQLTVYLASRTITREQFGECQITRGMAVGDARKGATTDALKKCATLIGVGLYLSRKEEATHAERDGERKAQPAPRPRPINNAVPFVATNLPNAANALICVECGGALMETKFKDNTVWSPTDLAGHGQRKYGRTLCMGCYRAAKAAATKQQAEQEQEAVF